MQGRKGDGNKMRTKEKVFLEYTGGQIPIGEIATKIKKELKKTNPDLEIDEMNCYIQPETNMVYYTINKKAQEDWCKPLDEFFK